MTFFIYLFFNNLHVSKNSCIMWRSNLTSGGAVCKNVSTLLHASSFCIICILGVTERICESFTNAARRPVFRGLGFPLFSIAGPSFPGNPGQVLIDAFHKSNPIYCNAFLIVLKSTILFYISKWLLVNYF